MPKFGSQVNLMGIPVLGFTPEAGTAFPIDPWEGRFFHRTDTMQFFIFLNGNWRQCDNQGVAAANHIHSIANVTGLQAALDAKAPTSNPTFTGTVTGVTKAHVGLGNVDNTSDANKPISTATQTALNGKAATVHTHTKSQITDLGAATETVAGLVELATTAEVTAGTDTTRAATSAGVKAAINAIVAAAPGTLDTLNELAAALGDDPNFATTMSNALAGKAPTVHGHALTDSNITGVLSVAKGGTGANNVVTARGVLGIAYTDSFSVPALTSGTWNSVPLPITLVEAKASFFDANNEEIIVDYKLGQSEIQVRPDVSFTAGALTMMVIGLEN